MVWILLVIIVGVVLYAISIFNSLNTLKVRIGASIQEIGNQLKRQVQLFNDINNEVQAAMGQETKIFQMLTDARKTINEAVGSGNAQKMSDASDKVTQLLPQLKVIVESNPQMQSMGVISRAMDESRDTSDKCMYARRTLIDLSADYNNMLVVFPSNIIAGAMGFKPEAGLKMADAGNVTEVSATEMQGKGFEAKQ
jgi:LemA protein